MISTQTWKARWGLFLTVQRLVLWVPAKFSIDEDTRNLAKALQINLSALNLYCVLVFFGVIAISVLTNWAGRWPSIRTFLVVLATIQAFKSLPVFLYLLVVNRRQIPTGQTHAGE